MNQSFCFFKRVDTVRRPLTKMVPEKMRRKTHVLRKKYNLHQSKNYMCAMFSFFIYDDLFDAKWHARHRKDFV